MRFAFDIIVVSIMSDSIKLNSICLTCNVVVSLLEMMQAWSPMLDRSNSGEDECLNGKDGLVGF